MFIPSFMKRNSCFLIDSFFPFIPTPGCGHASSVTLFPFPSSKEPSAVLLMLQCVALLIIHWKTDCHLGSVSLHTHKLILFYFIVSAALVCEWSWEWTGTVVFIEKYRQYRFFHFTIAYICLAMIHYWERTGSTVISTVIVWKANLNVTFLCSLALCIQLIKILITPTLMN